MLELESRVVVVLLSLLSGCILLYNTWGPVLAVVISLILVIYVCYSLITNDSLLSPHAFYFFYYFKETALELKIVIEKLIVYLLRYFHFICNQIKYVFEVISSTVNKMTSRRSSGYQLSSDTTFNSRNTSRFDIIPQLSPIPRTAHKINISDISNVSENKFNQNNKYQSPGTRNRYSKYMSTPLSVLKKDDLRELESDTLETTNLSSPKKNSPMFNQNHTLTRGENNTTFTPEGSPWGTSISPKMRSKAAGIKTVQTVAGPLLASTRYNIDPKTYTDITSPGLTLRLTKYAAEANNKLTHQSQYSTGQFPKVNLHASPIPLINTKFAKIRGPVTVRIAPPETTKFSPQERQKMLSDVCQSENKSPSSNVVQVLKEISLKRHASREDVTTEIVKKQRTDNMLINDAATDNFEETKQKRGRDESPKSDDENSSKNLRPTKRSKTPSCYDILRSLSSSVHVATGIKRKAVDCSRCGTPEFEKHFKSLKDSQHEDLQSPIELQIINKEDTDAEMNENKKRVASSPSHKSPDNNQKQPCVKGILKPHNNAKNDSESNVPPLPVNEQDVKPHEDKEEGNNSSLNTTTYTDKLFMKEEPKRNDKLKSFEEEQKHFIEAGFTTNDVEEIKKTDIVKMKQTSMRARLQSMFDAISGKAASGINPDVVIQAEEISEVAPTISSSTDCATLNSITTTTNVNTTPITTSALAPPLSPLSNTKPVKHITFNLPNTENVSGIKEQSASNLVSDDKNKSMINSETSTSKTDATPTSQELPNVTIITTTVSFTIPNKTVTETLPITTSANSVIVSPKISSGILKSSTPIINLSTSSTNVPTTTVILSIPSSSTSLFANKSTIANTATTSSFSDTTNNKTSIGKSFLPNSTNTGFTTSTNFPKFTFGNIANTTTTESSQINTASVQNTTSGLSFTTDMKNMFTAPANVTSITVGSSAGAGAGAGSAVSVFQNIGDNTTSNTFKNFSTTTTSSVPFIFGSNTTTTSKSEVSLFNTTTSNVVTNPMSSNTTIISINQPTTSNTMLNLANSTFNANASSGSTTFTFSTTKPIFSFGTSNASTTDNKSTFSYNANALGNSTGLLTSTNTPVTSTTSNNTTSGFNIPVVTSSTQFSTNASIFNTPSTTSVSIFSTPATTTASMFNTPATTTASMFNTPATTTASMFNTPATTTASMFNTPATTTASMFNTPSTTTASIFNAPSTTTVSMFSTPSTTATSMFNSPATTTVSMFNTPATTSGSMFNTPATTTSGSMFNTPATTTMFRTTTSEPVFGQSIAAPIFGNNNFKEENKPPAFGSTTTVFGSTSTPLFGSQTTAPPTFGSPSVSTSTLNFGNTNTTTPVFGAPNLSAPGSTQTSTTNSFACLTTPNPIFGNQNNPAAPFGSTTTTPVGTFNTPMQSTFETQQSTPLQFGAASNSNAFGDNKPSPFGIQTTVTPAFPTNENNTSNIFTFGGNQAGQQQQQQQQQQPTNTFTFGNNNASNNNTSTTGAVPFQFGASTSKPVTGFNFTAPSTTPSLNFGTSGTPTFNAPTPGMFSIGSGSTAPRSRPARGRKPR
ncbi:PREDICTED: uncharacterized threonine-rich GPI-anchored glycoprotein PJ4664.02-like [Polistes dominula]|uniref:Uncharacterized threonine-rich GPI-anchored glycoprotein PJ4664.02-like n=1 Tax=Polistes dominula TaxID=743375 RepID=A0ABM1ILS3_POLDO|nr:PREDICTED: uncharacterized threonine-rich GPI-anchored glycoprotein PJ4664.02-like [Polistes dominula]